MPKECTADTITEYALNAVNQGVTSLGIKGTLDSGLLLPILTQKSSYQWNCPRNREEVIVTAHRFVFIVKSQPDNPEHRHGLLGHGSRLPGAGG